MVKRQITLPKYCSKPHAVLLCALHTGTEYTNIVSRDLCFWSTYLYASKYKANSLVEDKLGHFRIYTGTPHTQNIPWLPQAKGLKTRPFHERSKFAQTEARVTNMHQTFHTPRYVWDVSKGIIRRAPYSNANSPPKVKDEVGRIWNISLYPNLMSTTENEQAKRTKVQQLGYAQERFPRVVP